MKKLPISLAPVLPFFMLPFFVLPFFVLPCFLPLDCAAAQAQASEKSFPEILQELEVKAGLAIEPNLPLLLRTERLEKTVFGCPQPGSIITRINGLTDLLKNGNKPQESPREVFDQENLPAEKLSSEKLAKVREMLANAHIESILPAENTTPPHFFRISKSGEVTKETSDYLEQVMAASKNRTFRFASMPITVYITPIQDQSLMKAVREGFFDWESRGAKVKFVETNAQSARIKVIWSRLGVSSDKNDCTLGAHTITKWTKHPSGKLAVMSISAIPVPIYIPNLGPKYTVPPQVIEVNLDLIYSKVPEARYLLTKNIIAHELGHAMGLLGHSPERGDLMFSITDEHSRLSQRDLNTLERLYQRKVDVPL